MGGVAFLRKSVPLDTVARHFDRDDRLLSSFHVGVHGFSPADRGGGAPRARPLSVHGNQRAVEGEGRPSKIKAITPFGRSRIAARMAGSLSAVERASAAETAGSSDRGRVRPEDVAISRTIASPVTATRLTDAP